MSDLSQFLQPFESSVLSNTSDPSKSIIPIDNKLNGFAFLNQTPSWWNIIDKDGHIVAHIVPFTSGNINLPNTIYEQCTLTRDLALPPLGSTTTFIFRIRLDSEINNNASSASISSLTATGTFSGALAAGNAHIGQVGIDTALPSGANNIGAVNVSALPALPSGTNTIGNVGVTSPLPSGANNIGSVNVSALPALPSGTNAIGTVGVTSLPAGVTTDINTIPKAASSGIIANAQYAVTTAAAQLTIPANVKTIVIKNMDSSAIVYIGKDATVTSSGATGGMPIDAKGSISFDVVSGSTIVIWAIGTANCNVAIMGVA